MLFKSHCDLIIKWYSAYIWQHRPSAPFKDVHLDVFFLICRMLYFLRVMALTFNYFFCKEAVFQVWWTCHTCIRGIFWHCFCHLVPFCNSEYLSFNLPYQQTPQNWVKFYPAFLPWGGFHTFSKLIQTSSTCQSNQFSLGERKDGWLFGRLADRGGQSKNLANPSKLLASGGKNLVNLAMITAGRAKKGSASAKYYSSPSEVLLLALYTACVTLQNTVSSHTEATEDLLISPLIFLSIFPPKAFLG